MTGTVASGIDPLRFRQILGHYPTGVVVITATVDGVPHGMAANSFVSVSLDPPLVAFCADHGSTTWPVLRRAGRFAVNVLGTDDEQLCRTFARKGADRFSEVAWSAGPNGSPRLDGALAWIDCVTDDVRAVGDHDMVVGRVLALSDLADGDPLLFFRGRYARLAP